MVISNDGSSIYMGTPTELMIFNAATNSLSREDVTVAGQVLAVSPDGCIAGHLRSRASSLSTSTATAAVTGTGTGTTTPTATSNYGGVATHAQFTQDNQTVYITMGTPDASDPTNPDKITPTNQMLVHSTFTGWSQVTLPNPASDVAITVPSVGAYLAGTPTTAPQLLLQHDHLRNRSNQVTSNDVLSAGRHRERQPRPRSCNQRRTAHPGSDHSKAVRMSDLTFGTALPPPPPEDPNGTGGLHAHRSRGRRLLHPVPWLFEYAIHWGDRRQNHRAHSDIELQRWPSSLIPAADRFRLTLRPAGL